MTALPDNIGLNGSSPKTMVDIHGEVLHHLRAAESMIGALAPNGRDYEDQRAISEASLEHRLRVASLREIIDDLAKIQKYWARRRDEKWNP